MLVTADAGERYETEITLVGFVPIAPFVQTTAPGPMHSTSAATAAGLCDRGRGSDWRAVY